MNIDEMLEISDCPLCEGGALLEEECGCSYYVMCLECGCHTVNIDFRSEQERLDAAKRAVMLAKEANPLYPVPILWDDKQLALMYHLVQEKKEKENNSHAETGHRDYTGISA